jgi:peptidoglycan/xylan/chitin deacetylase (PgdA/CDA1 family)
LLLARKAVMALMVTGLVTAGIFIRSSQEVAAVVASGSSGPALFLAPMPVDGRNAAQHPLSCVVVRSGPNLHSLADATEVAERLKRQGVQQVWVQFKQDETDETEGGTVFYPSEIAPVAPGFEDGRLLKFVDELRARGIAVSAWLPAFQDVAAWSGNPAWRAKTVSESGAVLESEGWLCPRHPAAVAHEASLLAEAAEVAGGRLAGIYTDFIRYDNDFSCVCDTCLAALSRRRSGPPLTASDIRHAATENPELWAQWAALRGDSIHDALDTMRDHLTQVKPGLWFGASVLPFSAVDYSFNTQSGQDLEKMCRAGVDEIVLMGYWDDWGKSPAWLAECVAEARRKVEKNARLSCLLDADMSVHRTMITLDAMGNQGCPVAWFNYGDWHDGVFSVLHRSLRQMESGVMPAPPFTAVTIRVDTEPDSNGSYEAIHPEMIGSLLGLFAEEKISATFVTVGRLADQQTAILRRALAEGHEIAGHGYNHEQIDSLPLPAQIEVIDRMTESFQRQGFHLTGFGAPRNSITDASRDRLIERGYFYDGSEAYDPLTSYEEARPVPHTGDPAHGIVLVPYIFPNDWDALRVRRLTTAQMQDAWCQRLKVVADAREPCFVLNVHQWLITQADHLAALRGFIHAVKARSDCRFLTLDAAAHHILRHYQQLETAPLPE